MSKYIIAVLFTIILLLATHLYKQNKTSIPKRFPIETAVITNETQSPPLLLYVFFSEKNCHDCLEVIKSLNHLPPYCKVVGIVPTYELKNESQLRNSTGATFPLVSADGFRRYIPWYTPSIVGVSPVDGSIIFTLPGVPGESQHLENFLEALYNKLYPILSEQIDKK